MTGFWDASALVPLCVPAQNSGNVRRLLREYAPVVWWGTTVEVVSALARLHRQRVLTAAQRHAARDRVGALRISWREIQPSSRLRELAEFQLDRHELKAADAVQLAAALVWCNERPRNRPFLCHDVKLRVAALHEGFLLVDL
jgi:predicted nucleic acid-binding protein